VFGEDLHGDESFQSVRIYGIDITALKKAEEARDELAAIVASTDDAIIGKTLDGKITTWNRGAERLYGYTSQEIVGQSITIIVPPDRKDEVSEILQKISQGESLDQYEPCAERKTANRSMWGLPSSIKNAEGRIIGLHHRPGYHRAQAC
jgi:PAS domain S-box-containing protein